MNPCNLFYNKVLKVNYKKFSVLLSKVLCLSLFLRKPAGQVGSICYRCQMIYLVFAPEPLFPFTIIRVHCFDFIFYNRFNEGVKSKL